VILHDSAANLRKISLFCQKRREKKSTRTKLFHKKQAIFSAKMGVYNPKMNCNNCDTATKQPVYSVNFVTILPFLPISGVKLQIFSVPCKSYR